MFCPSWTAANQGQAVLLEACFPTAWLGASEKSYGGHTSTLRTQNQNFCTLSLGDEGSPVKCGWSRDGLSPRGLHWYFCAYGKRAVKVNGPRGVVPGAQILPCVLVNSIPSEDACCMQRKHKRRYSYSAFWLEITPSGPPCTDIMIGVHHVHGILTSLSPWTV